MTSQAEHRYAAASELTHHRKILESDDVTLRIAQQPSIARVALGKDKDRKTICPPPVVKLSLSSRVDPRQLYMQSPYFFMTCSLLGEFDDKPSPVTLTSTLVGNLVSTVHRVKVKDTKDNKEDHNNSGSHESAYFVFADVSVKIEGRYRLQFSLFELKNFEAQCTYIQSIVSAPFWVHPAKTFPGVPKSSPLTQILSDQGVRLRIARVPRTKKRGPASDDYHRRHYGTRARLSQSSDQSNEEELPGNNQRDPDIQHESIDQSYSQIQDTNARGYFPGINHYTQNIPYNDSTPQKRPRVSSIHTSVNSYRQNSSIASPQTPIHNSYNTILQHSTFKYAESGNEQLQGRYYDNTGMMVSPQILHSPQEDYKRAQINTAFSQAYDTPSQPSIINQQHPNPRLAQLQDNISGPSANMQSLAYPPRSERMPENMHVFGYQARSGTLTLPSVTAAPSTGRTNNTELGGWGNAVPTFWRPPQQQILGSSAPFSVENITAAMAPDYHTTPIRSNLVPRTIKQSSFMQQHATEAEIHTRYSSWGHQAGNGEEVEEGEA